MTSYWERNPNIAFNALENSNFTCEVNSDHKTFLSHSTGKQYVEAHHLIPMEFQDLFESSIDVPENIISVCPNCHRAFHSSEIELRKLLISSLLESRKDGLKERGIEISIDKLFEYYKTSIS